MDTAVKRTVLVWLGATCLLAFIASLSTDLADAGLARAAARQAAPFTDLHNRSLIAPTARQIRSVMGRTVEVSDHRTHFVLAGKPLTIKDGRGTGTLTAAVGTRFPTADGAGQLTFFWHNRRFLGWDARYESAHIISVTSPGAGAFAIKYAHYGQHDALCCPTLHPVTVHSGWSGTILISDRVPPKGPGYGVRVMLLP